MEKMLQIIKPILAGVFECSADLIKLDTVPGDLERWDSMGHITMFAALEEKLGTSFTMEEITECESVKGIIELLQKRL